jgi:hypothetical protein
MLSTDLCQLKIVPADVDGLFLTTQTKMVLALWGQLLLNDVVSETLENKVTGF